MINIFKKFKDGLKKTTSNFSKGIIRKTCRQGNKNNYFD